MFYNWNFIGCARMHYIHSCTTRNIMLGNMGLIGYIITLHKNVIRTKNSQNLLIRSVYMN